jgi:DNA gyrase subunit A
LYRQTALQSNFGAIMLALCGSLPKQLTLRELLQEFLNFRETTLTKRYQYELEQAQQRLHLVEGLVKALENIEDLIRLLRFAPDNATAKTQLQAQFEMSVVQAEAILSMPLRRLTAMEQSGLHKEQDELRSQITALEFVLGDRRELLKNIKKDLRQLKKKHGNERRTRILSRELSAPKSESKAIEAQELFKEAPKPAPKAVVVQLTQKGYIKTIEGKSPKLLSNPDDLTVSTYYANTDQNLIVLTSSGKALPIAIADIPTTSARASKNRGTPLVALLPESAEPVISHFILDKSILDKSTLDQTDQSTEKSESSLVFLTAQAKIKRSPLSDFAGINSRGLMVVKLAEDDRLFWGGLVPYSQELAIATSTGRILRMAADETQIPTLGRTAMGNQAIRLRNSEQLVGIMPLDWTGSPDLELLLLTAQGYAKRLKAKDLRLSNRASIGSQAMMFKNKDDYLTAIAAIDLDQKQVNFVITKLKDETQTQAIDLDQIPLQPCNGSGLNLSELGIESNLLKILPSK